MNKVYKVIWNKARNCYVVVSEIAKRNGKCSSSLNKKIVAAFLAAGLVTALPMGVEAATKINNGAIGTTSGPNSAVVWGEGSVTNAAYRGTAFGQGTEASSNNTTAFGQNTKASHHNATSFGVGTYANSKQATAFGAYTYAGTVFTYKGEVVTPVRRVIERKDGYAKEAFVLLKEDGTFVNTGERFDGTYDAVGDITYSLNYQKLIDKLEKSKASGDEQRNATAFGEFSIATGQDATAFGYRSAATAWSATAWGHETAALGKRSTAFGVETWASGNNSTAFGYRTESTNENTTAWGSNTEATGIGATAWGSYTKSGGDNSTTWGKNSEVGSGSLTYAGQKYTNISIQVETWTEDADNGATYTYTWLDESGNIHTEQRRVQVLKGRYFVQGRNASGELKRITDKDEEGNEWVWNYNGETDQDTRESIKQWIKEQGGTLAGDYSTAFGDSSKVDAENALGALGGIVNANATNSAAIGKESSVSSANSYAMGNGATIGTDSEGSVALGGTTDSKQTKIGEGAHNAFAAVGGQVGKGAMLSIAIGQGTVVGEADSSTDNTDKGKQSVAIGVGNTVTGNNSIAIGTKLTVSGNNSGAFGDPSVLAADDSYVIGNSNNISKDATGAFILGNENYISGAGTFAIGSKNGSETAPIKDDDVFILGSDVKTTTVNSVFLGKGSGFSEGASTKGTDPYGTEDNKVTLNGKQYVFAGSNPVGVVSVGFNGKVDNVDTVITRRIQNVAAGLISADSTDAINGSQLYAAIKAMSIDVKAGDSTTKVETTSGGSSNTNNTDVATDSAGNTSTGSSSTAATTYKVYATKTTAKGDTNITVEDNNKASENESAHHYDYTISLNKDIDLTDEGSVTTGNARMDNDGLTVGDGDTKVTKDGLTITDGPMVTKTKVDAAGNKITNVGSGLGNTYSNATDNNAANIGDVKELTTQVTVNDNGAAENKNLELTTTTTENGRNIYDVKLSNNVDLTAGGSLSVGDTKLNNDGVTIAGGPSMTKAGIDAAGNKITNVQAGTDPTDAVNVSQLRDFAAQTNQNITNVDSRARKGVAGAAALAALHPLDFDPDDKLTFAAGMANFRGETAAAIGAFYRPDEKVMFSVGGTFGNGENLVNAGVSFSLDRTPRVTGSRTALTKEVVALREHVARQDAQIAELTALVRQLAGNAGVNMPVASSLPTAMPAMFPDNLDNKWAYDSIEELQQKGYITGYAGRTLTREEFAAALDMAMKRGAKLEERLVKAFEPELSHVRVAHVEGNGNEEGKWYERPRFSYDKLEKKHEIEKKNARIVPAKQK